MIEVAVQAPWKIVASTQPAAIAGALRAAFCDPPRQKIGVVYGDPETTTVVNALEFSCSVQTDIRPSRRSNEGDEVAGSQCKVKVVKNKLAPPFREADVAIRYGTDVNQLGELGDTAEKLGLVVELRRCQPACERSVR